MGLTSDGNLLLLTQYRGKNPHDIQNVPNSVHARKNDEKTYGTHSRSMNKWYNYIVILQLSNILSKNCCSVVVVDIELKLAQARVLYL